MNKLLAVVFGLGVIGTSLQTAVDIINDAPNDVIFADTSLTILLVTISTAYYLKSREDFIKDRARYALGGIALICILVLIVFRI